MCLQSALFGHRRMLLFASLAVGTWLLAAWATPASATGAQPPPNDTIPDQVLYLPAVQRLVPLAPCPAISVRTYEIIPVDGPPSDHPAELHGDLNLGLRGYLPVVADRQIIEVDGPADEDAPQIPGLFADSRVPRFTSTHRVYEWDWTCGEHGCRADQFTPPEVTLLGMGVAAHEPIAFPSRGPQIYVGGYKVLVLYAAEDRITLGYTRHDSVAPGYAVHVEKVCVDPNLLALYRQANDAGRSHLPALRDGETWGTARGEEILVAIRDRGTFMEPRSRKDWWQVVGAGR